MSTLSRTEYPNLTGSTGAFVIPFPFLNADDIEVFIDGKSADIDHYKISGTSLEFLTGYYPEGNLIIQRVTDLSDRAARFAGNSPIRSSDLNASMDQTLFAAQEVVDGFKGLGISFTTNGNTLIPKSVVGLENVDNTSDLEKPISTSVQTALDGKLDASEFNTKAIFNTVVSASGGISNNLNAFTISGKKIDYLLDFRNVTNKPLAYPPTIHTHSAEDITVGQFPPNVIPSQGVTQHQAALVINYNQLRGVPPGSLGEIPDNDGLSYLRTQGAWVEFNPDVKADKDHSHVIDDVAGLKSSLNKKQRKLDKYSSAVIGTGPSRILFKSGVPSGTGLRNYFVPRNPGDTQWDWNREFGYSHEQRHWYVKGGLTHDIQGSYYWHGDNFDPASKADVTHAHVIGDITGLQDALDVAGTSGGLDIKDANVILTTSTASQSDPLYVTGDTTVTVPSPSAGWNQSVFVSRGVTATFNFTGTIVRDKDGNVFDTTTPNNQVVGPAYLELVSHANSEVEIWV